jgi:hypothetical protein
MTFQPTHRTTKDLIGADKGTLLQFVRTEKYVTGPPEYSSYIMADGREFGSFDIYVEPIPQEEPVGLEIGKRYRVTFEGEANGSGFIDVTSALYFNHSILSDAVSVELIPNPLPTTPGSVILDRRRRSHIAYQLLSDAETWRGTSGHEAPTKEVATWPTTLLLDAGADK